MSRPLLLTLFIGALLGWIVFCTQTHGPEIGRKLLSEIDSITQQTASGLDIKIDGHTATLIGMTDSQDHKIEIGNAYLAHPAIDAVDNQIKVLNPLSIKGLDLPKNTLGTGYIYDGKQLEIIGGVPGVYTAERLQKEISTQLKGLSVDTSSVVPGYAGISNWKKHHDTIVDTLAKMRSGQVALTPSKVYGNLQTDERYLRQRATKAFQNWPGFSPAEFQYKLVARNLSPAGLACQKDFETTLTGEHIRFDVGSAAVSADSQPLLNKLVGIMKKCPGAKIEVEGHTDADGADASNLTLSQARAASVKAILIQKGQDANKIKAIGYGEKRPIATNATETGKEQNRRIEFRVIE